MTATDGGGLSARFPVTVTLEDANEAPGDIEMAAGGTVAEHAPANTPVGRVSASDPDAGDRLAYSLVEDADGRFAIDPESGTIRVAEGADLEFGAVIDRFTINPDNGLIVPSNGGRLDLRNALAHKVVVRVTDAGGLSQDAALAIQVGDVNDRPWAEAVAFTVEENSPGGTVVGRISAKDPDGGTNGKLSYAITSGDGRGRFAIDAGTGQVTVADGSSLDFEAGADFELTATVSDGGGLSTAVPVTIALADVNEPPAGLGMTGGTVAEHAGNGTVVARLLASDPDAGDRLTYSLSDDGGGRFAIDAETGTVLVADGARLDFDEAPRHEIGVQVTDSGGLSHTETLTVMVGNENFAPTGVTLSNAAVAENAPGGTLVAEISARDPDAGEHLT
ncbi:MAG: cadherin repeat domain-containing protein, partial [Chloroflexi bacterium]|nr:cadherin repeat domain-containing protein [Chloroflexota bacterium]